MFRWLNLTVRPKSFVGDDPTGTERQLLAALILYCLLVLLNADNKGTFSPAQLLRELENALSWLLYQTGYLQACLYAGVPPPEKLPPSSCPL